MVGKLKSLEEILSNDVKNNVEFNLKYVMFLSKVFNKVVKVENGYYGYYVEDKEKQMQLMNKEDFEWILTDAQYKTIYGENYERDI